MPTGQHRQQQQQQGSGGMKKPPHNNTGGGGGITTTTRNSNANNNSNKSNKGNNNKRRPSHNNNNKNNNNRNNNNSHQQQQQPKTRGNQPYPNSRESNQQQPTPKPQQPPLRAVGTEGSSEASFASDLTRDYYVQRLAETESNLAETQDNLAKTQQKMRGLQSKLDTAYLIFDTELGKIQKEKEQLQQEKDEVQKEKELLQENHVDEMKIQHSKEQAVKQQLATVMSEKDELYQENQSLQDQLKELQNLMQTMQRQQQQTTTTTITTEIKKQPSSSLAAPAPLPPPSKDHFAGVVATAAASRIQQTSSSASPSSSDIPPPPAPPPPAAVPGREESLEVSTSSSNDKEKVKQRPSEQAVVASISSGKGLRGQTSRNAKQPSPEEITVNKNQEPAKKNVKAKDTSLGAPLFASPKPVLATAASNITTSTNSSDDMFFDAYEADTANTDTSSLPPPPPPPSSSATTTETDKATAKAVLVPPPPSQNTARSMVLEIVDPNTTGTSSRNNNNNNNKKVVPSTNEEKGVIAKTTTSATSSNNEKSKTSTNNNLKRPHKQNRNIVSIIAKRKQKSIQDYDVPLVDYLFPKDNNNNNNNKGTASTGSVSPVFDLFDDAGTVPYGRKIVLVASEAKEQQIQVDEAKKTLHYIDSKIKLERKIIQQTREKVNTLDETIRGVDYWKKFSWPKILRGEKVEEEEEENDDDVNESEEDEDDEESLEDVDNLDTWIEQAISEEPDPETPNWDNICSMVSELSGITYFRSSDLQRRYLWNKSVRAGIVKLIEKAMSEEANPNKPAWNNIKERVGAWWTADNNGDTINLNVKECKALWGLSRINLKDLVSNAKHKQFKQKKTVDWSDVSKLVSHGADFAFTEEECKASQLSTVRFSLAELDVAKIALDKADAGQTSKREKNIKQSRLRNALHETEETRQARKERQAEARKKHIQEKLKKRAERKKENTYAKKETRKKEASKQKKLMEKRIAAAEESLKDKESQRVEAVEAIEKEGEKLRNVHDRLEALLDTSDIVEGKIKEVLSFDIKSSKSERGLTLLVLSVLSSDIETLLLCLQLGADPTEKVRGIPPTDIAEYFGLVEVTELLIQNGGILRKEHDAWDAVLGGQTGAAEHIQDWEGARKIAEQAAVPVDDLLQKAAELEASDNTRMPILTKAEREERSWEFFDSSLVNAAQHGIALVRMVYLEQDVSLLIQRTETPSSLKVDFADLLLSLVPSIHRDREPRRTYPCVRRAIIGIMNPYELLAFRISGTYLALLTPFVSSFLDGKFCVGLVVWAVVQEQETSMYKTLIESTDFLRHKPQTDDRFPGHHNFVLALGKDTHLLDLKSTSIYTSQPMNLFEVGIDHGLGTIGDSSFAPKLRVLDSDKRLAKAIFRTSASEVEDQELLLAESRADTSTQLSGGAGTGKTLTMAKKVISEDVETRILLLSRLPRLVSAIKARVREERDTSNIVFSTYDELCSSLATSVKPRDGQVKQFPFFARVQYAEISSDAPCATFGDFIGYLSAKEKKRMLECRLEPSSIWCGIRTIKSNAQCIARKSHLTREEYNGLPSSYGLSRSQRDIVYDLYEVYQEWLTLDGRKWDEADRILYILAHSNRVFWEDNFVSWWDRYLQGDGDGLVDDYGVPLTPFFSKVFIDEAQDFSELDLTLFLRMSSGTRSVFLAADPAQSVEVGLRMRRGMVNDVFHGAMPQYGGEQVKDVLQELALNTNHRTHAGNLNLSKAIRKILTRSYGVPGTQEQPLINGPIPEALILSSRKDMVDPSVFRGANIVILVPDENLEDTKTFFRTNNISNDIFGVREAKGLEFDSVCLLSFFSYFEKRESSAQWRNALLWLFSNKGITTTESAEIIKVGSGKGQKLESCDYLLSHPETEDEAMLFYTAVTRARNRVFLVEFQNDGIQRKRGEKGLADFAFRCLKQLDLAKSVQQIDEGRVEMTPQEHKARGVTLVTNAINFAKGSSNISAIKEKFGEAIKRFKPAYGDDQELLAQATKHMQAVICKVQLLEMIRTKFFDSSSASYTLNFRMAEMMIFEAKLLEFANLVAWDTFLMEECDEVIVLVTEMVQGTPYEIRFGRILSDLGAAREAWVQTIENNN